MQCKPVILPEGIDPVEPCDRDQRKSHVTIRPITGHIFTAYTIITMYNILKNRTLLDDKNDYHLITRLNTKHDFQQK